MITLSSRAEYKQARIAAYGAMDPKLAKQLTLCVGGYLHKNTIARTAGVSTQYTADSGTSFATLAVAALGTMAEFHANAGQRVRVVLSWDQCLGYDMFDPELNADFE